MKITNILQHKLKTMSFMLILLLCLSIIVGCTTICSMFCADCYNNKLFYQQVKGSWYNIDENTGGVTKITIEKPDSEIFVQAWGACVPQDCDWGRTLGIIDANILKVTWCKPQQKLVMNINLENDQLIANISTYEVDNGATLTHQRRDIFERNN